MTIVTQDEQLINYDNIIKVAVFLGNIEDVEYYNILAFANNSKDYDGDVENAIQLGLYANDKESYKAMRLFTDAIVSGKKIFKMPDSEIFMYEESVTPKENG